MCEKKENGHDIVDGFDMLLHVLFHDYIDLDEAHELRLNIEKYYLKGERNDN